MPIEKNFENGPQLQREEEAIWKIPMLKLLGQLLNEFLRLGFLLLTCDSHYHH
jgi:hypothetical protein